MKKIKLTKPALNDGIMRSRGNVVEVDNNKYDYMIGMGDGTDAAGLSLTPAPPPLDRANENFTMEQLRSMFSAISQMNIPDEKKRELEANAEAKIKSVADFDAKVNAEVEKRMAAKADAAPPPPPASGKPAVTPPADVKK